MKRIISAVLGIILIGIVVFLGVKSGDDSWFVVPFGITSALIAPLGISALGYSIRKEDPTLKKLALVPEIDSLIEKAETEAEKIKRLKREKNELLNYIQNETKRIALVERKKILETEIQRISDEYQKVKLELAQIEGKKPNMDEISGEIRKFYTNKSEASLIVFGERYVIKSIYDFYNLPAIIIINAMNKMVIMFVDRIQIMINRVINKD